jgi:hypothetical protein
MKLPPALIFYEYQINSSGADFAVLTSILIAHRLSTVSRLTAS